VPAFTTKRSTQARLFSGFSDILGLEWSGFGGQIHPKALDRTFLPPSYRRRTTVFDAYQCLNTVFEAYHLMTHHLTTYDPMSYSLFLLPVFSSCI